MEVDLCPALPWGERFRRRYSTWAILDQKDITAFLGNRRRGSVEGAFNVRVILPDSNSAEGLSVAEKAN